MPDMSNTLDYVLDECMKEAPNLSETEAAFSVIRLNLTALVSNLIQIGIAGEGLSNDSLYGFTSGLMDTIDWMVAKEMASEAMSDIEDELSK